MVSIYFAEGVASKIVWRITRGDTDVPVDFGPNGAEVTLISNDGVLHVDSYVADSALVIPLSTIRPQLPANVYSIKARWTNSSNPDYPSVAFVRNVFAVTRYPYEATHYSGSTITIKIKSSIDPPAPGPEPEPEHNQLHYVDCGQWVDGRMVPNPVPGYGIYLVREYNSLTKRWETHDVWHLGCKWRCVVHQPMTVNNQLVYAEPKWNSPAWLFLEGNDIVSAKIISTKGDKFRLGFVNTQLVGRVMFGYTDITNDVPEINFNWSRRTEQGQSAGDITWGTRHQGMKNVTLTNADMPSNWAYDNMAIFTLTVTVSDGRDTVEIERDWNVEF